MGRRICFSLFLCLLLSSILAIAQETTGGIQGTVKDPQGAVVAGATVEVAGPALIGKKVAKTDQGGFYHVEQLPPGTYDISVSAPGFAQQKKTGLKLETGALPTVNVTLPVGSAAETVEVSGEAELIDVTQSKVAVTVSDQILQNIPKGRSFQSVIQFAPGARQEPLSSRGRGNAAGMAGSGAGFQIDGASDSENTYLIEGMDTTNIQDGGVGKNVPMEFVQEVQVKSTGFEAEYGGALGGVVNVIQKRGSNNWHGMGSLQFRSDALNGNDQCVWFTLCGLRTDPNFSFSASGRKDAPQQYYVGKKDRQRIWDPGFEISGPLKKDKLTLYLGYVPSFDRLTRKVNFTGATSPGLHTFHRDIDTHNALTRLDWLATSRIRTFAAWQYGYSRTTGIDPAGTSFPNPDSVFGQRNTSATSNPASFRPQRGYVNPSSVYNFGSDFTVTDHFVLTTRFGYWFSNLEDRGTPSGNRYLYVAGSVGQTGVPTQFQQPPGFQNIAANQKRFFDAYKRTSFSTDGSYLTKFFGTHSLKIGYGFNRLANDVLLAFDGTLTRLSWGQAYVPLDPKACGVAGRPSCQGTFGYYVIRDGVDNQGKVSSYNHALYAQDAWTLGHGVTLNLGVRFDKEHVPAYQKGAPSIDFGWTQKVAPRLGGAWDVLNNGKLKAFASFGYFYDIMKLGLPRGSFGGDYWHDCVYTLDDPDYTKIVPTVTNNHFCPTSGPASGSTTGQFIENVNFRSVILDPTDPGVDPNLKPMKQHESTVGIDWAITPSLGLETRYTRKRLDYTIEDVGVAVPGNELYYIGNPGYGIVKNLLQRNTIDSSDPFSPPTVFPPQCADCPLSPKAVRNYDGVEFRLTKRYSTHWFGSASYTYSKLRGNYGGLTSSEITDGSGGRHSPNNSRYFDLPNMAWTSHGTADSGRLPTDRPHTLKLFGSYTLRWFGQETSLGLDQLVYSGTPITTCFPEVSTQSSCSMVEGRGGFVQFSQAPGGDIQLVGIQRDRRTPVYTNTDLSLRHEFGLSKEHEKLRLALEWNAFNVLNQHAKMGYYVTPLGGGATVTPRIGGAVTGSPTDWHALTDKGWNYVATSNLSDLTRVSGGKPAPIFAKTIDNRYGAASLFQAARTMRLGLKVTF